MCVFRMRRDSAGRKKASVRQHRAGSSLSTPPTASESSPKNVQVRVNPPPHTSQRPEPPPPPSGFFHDISFASGKLIRDHKGHWFRLEIFLVHRPGKIKANIRNLIRCGGGRQTLREPTPLKCVFPALQSNIPSAPTSLDVSCYAKMSLPSASADNMSISAFWLLQNLAALCRRAVETLR